MRRQVANSIKGRNKSGSQMARNVLDTIQSAAFLSFASFIELWVP
jgi:hypothetical protein